MPYEVYKVLHLLAIFMVFASLGGLVILHRMGAEADEARRLRKLLAVFHGVALLVVIVAGFGLMARTGVGMGGSGWPAWIYGKMAIWLALGAASMFVRRFAGATGYWLIGLPLLGGLAAYLVLTGRGG
jgi:uncharacterized membrane protein